jgi:23S rRNA pseudouridine1911/1915/1917 synthase
MEVPIIYEDTDVVVVNKPAGIVVHGDGRTVEPTLVDWIKNRYPALEGVGEPMTLSNGSVIDRPGIVHRLDRETSGVLVVAKSAEAFAYLKEQFQGRHITKQYNAFVYGSLPQREGVIDLPIGKSRGDFRRWSAQQGTRGVLREAVTAYSVVREGTHASFIDVEPKTGRTHQIRVHFKAINHPVVCDQLYATGRPCLFGFERLALHARLLRLTLPGGVVLAAEAPLPDDFERALQELS